MSTARQTLVRLSGALLVALVVALGASLGASAPAQAQNYGPLQGAQWGQGSQATVVILHGDVSGGDGKSPARYHYDLAARIARQNGTATVIALLRPGYHDGKGRQSPGRRSFDQYTRTHNNMLAEALEAIRSARPGAELIVVGHSGGAAQLGAVIGRFPGLVDTAILMACPCDLATWRKGRKAMTKGQSPHRFVRKIAPDTRIVALTGQDDTNTTPALARAYIARTQKAGLDSELVLVPGAGHQGRPLYEVLYRIVKAEVRS